LHVRAQVSPGQLLRFTGDWAVHPTYGPQLQATAIDELPAPTEKAQLVAYLSGGIIPGVGPVTAQVRSA
jgi:exodeoxyribonuclease V alpha subunit